MYRAALQTSTWNYGNVRREYFTISDRKIRASILTSFTVIRPPHLASKVGAVLILLYERAGRIHVLLTTRSKELRSHPGQTALPGGKVDKEDSNAIETAVSSPSIHSHVSVVSVVS